MTPAMSVASKGQVADLAVIGGGIAGMIAANSAAEQGLQVVVLERGSEDRYLCNSRFTGGVFHVAFHNPMRPADDLRRIIEASTGGAADPAMADAVAENLGHVIRWLQQQGIQFVKAGRDEWQDFILAPPQYPRAGLHWPGRGGDVLLRTLEQRLLERNGCIMRGARVVGLERAGGRFNLSIEAESGSCGMASTSVVIADGGFQGNPEMLRAHVTVEPQALRQRGAGTGCGDGVELAKSLGASFVAAGEFYGHVLSRDSLNNDKLWPYPWIDDLAGAGIAVDCNGRRFTDEGRGGVVLANAIARLSDPAGAVAVFDEDTWTQVGTNMLIPANPLLEVHGCQIFKASTIEDLAKAVGLDPEALSATVDSYNAALVGGKLEQLFPPRGQKRFQSRAVVRAPFRAIRLAAGITYTMGGIAIDGSSRVLDINRRPIEGLFAAGATTGGLEGGAAVGYVGGLVKSAVTGFLAGQTVAHEHLKKSGHVNGGKALGTAAGASCNIPGNC